MATRIGRHGGAPGAAGVAFASSGGEPDGGESASPRMRAALGLLARAAPHDAAVLLEAAPGADVAALARFLHARSARAAGPFAALACAAVEPDEHARALFGGEPRRGAGERGLWAGAAGGTLFLEDVGELSPAAQARLARHLAAAPGARRPGPRVVASTSEDLDGLVHAGRFRADLVLALEQVEVPVPALRERAEDVLPLARALVAELAAALGLPRAALSPAAEQRLAEYPWPGDVRELRNALQHALVQADGPVVAPSCLPARVLARAGGPVLGGAFSARDIEREHIERVLAWAPTHAEAARVLGLNPTTLWRKRHRWGP